MATVGGRYFRLRLLQVVIPVMMVALWGVLRCTAGHAAVHFYVPPGSSWSLRVDGASVVTETAAAPSHRVVSVSGGRHELVVEAPAGTRRYDVDLGTFTELLVPTSGQCFVWVDAARQGRETKVGISARYQDNAPIDLPPGALVGPEDFMSAPARSPAVFLPLACEDLSLSDEVLLRQL